MYRDKAEAYGGSIIPDISMFCLLSSNYEKACFFFLKFYSINPSNSKFPKASFESNCRVLKPSARYEII